MLKIILNGQKPIIFKDVLHEHVPINSYIVQHTLSHLKMRKKKNHLSIKNMGKNRA